VSAEGHSVSLPFTCASIHPLGESHGLLLQRQEDQDDIEARTLGGGSSGGGGGGATMMSGTPYSSNNADINVSNSQQPMEEEDDDDEFFLNVPPRNTKMGATTPTDATASAAMMTTGMPGQFPLSTPRGHYGGPVEVSSLFSLKHPLEDVLPVAQNVRPDNDNSNSGEAMDESPLLVTDVFETILCTSTLKWTDPTDPVLEKKYYEQPICVTYNTILKRYV